MKSTGGTIFVNNCSMYIPIHNIVFWAHLKLFLEVWVFCSTLP